MPSIRSDREILTRTPAADEEYHRDKWTLFGNEAEKMEIAVIRNQRLLRKRVDKLALRQQVGVPMSPGLWLREPLPAASLRTEVNALQDSFRMSYNKALPKLS